MNLDPNFDRAYREWFEKHLHESAGDRRVQLERRWKEDRQGEEGGEKLFLRSVWWPVRGSFNDLIPEFEIVDKLGVTRFLDHAYMEHSTSHDFETDGYGPHMRHASSWTFSDDRRRDAALRMLGWQVLRFSYSDLKRYPLSCQQLLRMWLEYFAPLTKEQERENLVYRLGMYRETFSLTDAAQMLGCSEPVARNFLKKMVAEGKLEVRGMGVERIHLYRLSDTGRRALRLPSEPVLFRE